MLKGFKIRRRETVLRFGKGGIVLCLQALSNWERCFYAARCLIPSNFRAEVRAKRLRSWGLAQHWRPQCFVQGGKAFAQVCLGFRAAALA